MFNPAYQLPLIKNRQYRMRQYRGDVCVEDDEGECVLQFTAYSSTIAVDGRLERLGAIVSISESWNLFETPIQTRTELGTSSAQRAVALSAIHLITKGRA